MAKVLRLNPVLKAGGNTGSFPLEYQIVTHFFLTDQ